MAWTSKRTKKLKNIVLALEMDDAQEFLENIRNLEPYNSEEDWHFESVSSSEEIESIEPPDVLLLYMFLDGDKPGNMLKYVAETFKDTHVILYVRDMNNQAKHYIKQAKELGLVNVVTGELPGTPPYTVDLALRYTYRDVTKGKAEEMEPSGKRKERDLKGRVHGQRQPGIKVVFTADKGGIGKTSVCAGTAIALSKAGNQITIADADFSRMNMTAFFKVDSKYGGIDQINDSEMISPAMLENLIVPVKQYPNLQVLPGPENKFDFDSSVFSDEDILNILDTLTGTAPFVLVDAPSSPDDKRNPSLMAHSDIVVVILDQSAFTLQDCTKYGEYLLQCGVEPEKVRLVINRFSKKLLPIGKIIKAFNEGMGSKTITPTAIIDQDWEGFAIGSHKSTVPGLNDPKGAWHKLAESISIAAGVPYKASVPGKGSVKGLFSFLKRASCTF